ncbi:hypothetical protein ABW06_24800 [Pluralibacter gergoviae]|uniref:Uncharacterized protein n=1 Tax=Pluralibacter gergoviae TaxID=61647 RepID=A0A0J5KQ61_PLUGE|nr:hypothetical protein [Pluralibacter gergoviae]KMK08164.1 hypothetical protein ABW06_24800 [Pluralibacter gergoviae]
MAQEEILVTTEEQAYQLIESYMAGNALPEHISFDGWPNLSFRLEGENFNQSLTPSVMKGFIEMQAQINRAFALAKFGIPDPRKLTKEDREELEIKVEVKKGSSLLTVDLNGFLTKLSHELVGKMSAQEIMVTVISAALIWGGVSIFRRYLDNRKEVRLAELNKDGDKENLRTLQSMSEEETKRIQIMANFMKEKPLLDNMDRMAYDAKSEIVKSFTRADKTEIDGITIDAETAKDLTTNARKRSAEMRIDGIYRIEEVNNTDPEAFKVKVRNVKDGQRLTCLVQDIFLDESGNKEALQQAEWERKPVHLSINAKHIDGDIKSAIILYVKDVTMKPE